MTVQGDCGKIFALLAMTNGDVCSPISAYLKISVCGFLGEGEVLYSFCCCIFFMVCLTSLITILFSVFVIYFC